MDKVILKSRQVRREDGPALKRAHLMEHGARAEVRTISEGGIVRAIEVVCACGDVITVDLDVSQPQARGEQVAQGDS